MNSTLPPDTWRSEAFAEDLCDELAESPVAAQQRGTTLMVLWGVLPVVLAVGGAAVMAWSGA